MIRKSKNKTDLTNSRTISHKLLSTPPNIEQKSLTLTLLLAQWAQFIYEDVGQIASNRLFLGKTLKKIKKKIIF